MSLAIHLQMKGLDREKKVSRIKKSKKERGSEEGEKGGVHSLLSVYLGT